MVQWFMNMYGKDGFLIRKVKASSVARLEVWLDYYENRPKGLGRFTAWTERDFEETDFDTVVNEEIVADEISSVEDDFGFGPFEKDGVP